MWIFEYVDNRFVTDLKYICNFHLFNTVYHSIITNSNLQILHNSTTDWQETDPVLLPFYFKVIKTAGSLHKVTVI